MLPSLLTLPKAPEDFTGSSPPLSLCSAGYAGDQQGSAVPMPRPHCAGIHQGELRGHRDVDSRNRRPGLAPQEGTEFSQPNADSTPLPTTASSSAAPPPPELNALLCVFVGACGRVDPPDPCSGTQAHLTCKPQGTRPFPDPAPGAWQVLCNCSHRGLKVTFKVGT